MKHSPVLALAITALLASTAQAQVNFGIGASLGNLNYQIESSTQQKWAGSAKASTLSGDVGLPGGFYVGVSALQTSSGDLDFTFRNGTPFKSDFKRNDVALTLGWSAANRLNTFVGIKSATSEIKNTIGTQFATTGYFVGLSYPISFGSSTLALSGAIGLNTGKWRETGREVKESATGFSGGLKYAYAFTPNIVASLGVKAQRYSYDFSSTLGKTLEESVRSVDLGVNFNF